MLQFRSVHESVTKTTSVLRFNGCMIECGLNHGNSVQTTTQQIKVNETPTWRGRKGEDKVHACVAAAVWLGGTSEDVVNAMDDLYVSFPALSVRTSAALLA